MSSLGRFLLNRGFKEWKQPTGKTFDQLAIFHRRNVTTFTEHIIGDPLFNRRDPRPMKPVLSIKGQPGFPLVTVNCR